MTDIASDGIQIINKQTSSSSRCDLVEGETKTLILPSPLVNSIINLNYTLNDEPVLSGVIGTLVINGQYENGPITHITDMNISAGSSYNIEGKYTKVILELTDLKNADTVIAYIDQNANIK
jgi:hypothetical protein